jgi:serine/threonine-protein kinase RsbW
MSSPSDPGEKARTHEDTPPAGTRAPDGLRVTLPAVPVSASLARDRLRRWLRALRWPPGQLADIVLAVNEAVSNGVEHAYRAAVPGLIDIEARVLGDPPDGRRVEVTVRDSGSWRPSSAAAENRGRGIPLMRACMDHVTVDGTDHGTVVTLLSRTVPLASVTRR